MQDLMHDLDDDASEMVLTPDEDDSENAHTSDSDATVDEDTPDEDVLENVDAPDEVVPPAPTTPDRPIQQHPLPPVDAMDLTNQHIANRWGPRAARRMAEAEQLMEDEFWDFVRQRRPGPRIPQPQDVTARRRRASFTAELISFSLNHVNADNPNFVPISNRARLRTISRHRCQTCQAWTGRTSATRTEGIIWVSNASCYYCTWTVSWSLATDDLRQTLTNVEDHVRSRQGELQRDRYRAQERVDIMRYRRVANEGSTERRVRELQYYRQSGPEIYLAFVEGVEG